MKKSLLALSAAAIALSASAVSPKQLLNQGAQHLDKTKAMVSARGFDFDKRSTHSSAMRKAPSKMSSADVITEVQGPKQTLAITATGYMNSYWGVYGYWDETVASHIVYGEDNDVYLYDLIPFANSGSYVKGVRNGDSITISLPQIVEYYDDYEVGCKMCVMKSVEILDEDGYIEDYTYEPTDAQSVTLSVAEDGSMQVEGIDYELILGLAWTDDDSWVGFGVAQLSAEEFNVTPVTPPSDIEVSRNFWTYNAGEYGWPVSWAQGYDEFYFQGICSFMPEAWVKGTVEYGDSEAVISIPQGQYVGMYGSYFIKTKFAAIGYDEEWDYEYYEDLPEDYCYQLIWDYEENTITAKDPEVAFLFNASATDYSVLQEFYGLTLVHQDSYEGTPANPYGLEFNPEYESQGYGEFRFNVPAVSTEGDVLLTENLSYIIYVDDDQWTFEPDEYETAEAIDEIPWNLSLYYIYAWKDTEREVDFFVEGITTLGVQSVYRYNGEETRSEIVTLNLDDPSAVNGISDVKKVADVKYYGIDGREVANPAAGIFVKRVTFEDGSVATFKKAIKK